ncbi:nitrite reductase [Lampropedia cohaerens]|uniref:Nitrite reductase n=1 Tax=Lampropedia cohaerens TaxID=1610491 RepID=A0A0U1Q0V7_9BURK|nr:nitrite reductase [Lampropedia cohaerens]
MHTVAPDPGTASAGWQPICPLAEIWLNTGVCALVQGRQIAIFHLPDGRLFAIDNYDPKSCANVLSRGILGDIAGEPVVASPIYKQHYQLRTGTCMEDEAITLRTYTVEVRDGVVWINV